MTRDALSLKIYLDSLRRVPLLCITGQADAYLTKLLNQNLLIGICQVSLLGRRHVENTLLSSLLFYADPAKVVHEVRDDAVDGAEGIDDDLFLLLLLLFVVTLDCALDSVGGRSVLCEDLFDGLLFDFFLCHNLLVFCDVDVCFFFDVVGENVYRDICKLKRSLNVL